MYDREDPAYIRFEAEMLKLGWDLNCIETWWLETLKSNAEVSDYSIVYRDNDPFYSSDRKDRE